MNNKGRFMRISLHKISVVTLLAGVLLLSACSGVKIRERVEASAELQQARTYSWKSTPVSSKGLANDDSTHFDAELRKTVESVLALRGYRQVKEGADFLMDYRITVVPAHLEIEQQDNYLAGSQGRIEFNQIGTVTLSEDFYQRGYLALTAFAPDKKTIWWESIGNKLLDESGVREKRDRNLRQAVGKMMKPFPRAAQ